MRKAPGENRRPRGTAQGVGHEIVRKSAAVFLHLENVRHVLHQIHGQVISQDENDIRTAGSGGVRLRRRRSPRNRREILSRIGPTESRVPLFACRDELRIHLRQRFFAAGHRRSLHEGLHAIQLEPVSPIRPFLFEASISAGRDNLLARLSGGALPCGRRSGYTEEREPGGKQEGLSGYWCSSDNIRLTGTHDSVPPSRHCSLPSTATDNPDWEAAVVLSCP